MAAFAASSTCGEFVAKCRDPRGGFHPGVKHLPHRASHMLGRLRTQGSTVGLKTGKWSRAQKLSTIKRGSHQSACQHSDFLCEEFFDMIRKGHRVLLSAHLVLEDDKLRLSPLGVVPQRDRRPRTICDYTIFSVNLDTTPLTPTGSMQFGKTLCRILQQVSTADPRLGPVHLYKIDIADGFYIIWITPNNVPKLGVVFPGAPGEEPLIGFPLVLPMGWIQPPPPLVHGSDRYSSRLDQPTAASEWAHHPALVVPTVGSGTPPPKRKGRLNPGALQPMPSLLLSCPQDALAPP
jgi:hypothetical protein